MKEETIRVKADVTQIADGTRYEGSVSFDDYKFSYHLTFGVHLDKLSELAQKSSKEALETILFDVKDEQGKSVVLDEESKLLFVSTVGRLVMEFYESPQTRASQEGFLGAMLKHGEKDITSLKELGFSGVSIGSSTEYDLPKIPELMKFLESYKK